MLNQPEIPKPPKKANQKLMTPKEVKTKTKIKASTKIIIGAILAVGVAIGIGAVIFFFGGGPVSPPTETARFEVEFAPVNKETWDSLENNYDTVSDYFKDKFNDFFPPDERDDIIYLGAINDKDFSDSLEENHLWDHDKVGAGGVILDTFYFTHAHRLDPNYGNKLLKTVNDQIECDKINEFSLTPPTMAITLDEIHPTDYGTLPSVEPILKDSKGENLDKGRYHIRYKSLNPEIAVVYPDGHILPVSPGSVQIRASVCNRQSDPVSVEIKPEGFSKYNLAGKINTQFINGVARSKVIDLGDLSGKFIKKLTLHLNISDLYEEEELNSKINFYASNDGGITWVKADTVNKPAHIEKADGEIKYPTSITFDFSSKRPGNQLRLAMEAISDAKAPDVTPGTEITGEFTTEPAYLGNTFAHVRGLMTKENINSGVYGLLLVDDYARYFNSKRYKEKEDSFSRANPTEEFLLVCIITSAVKTMDFFNNLPQPEEDIFYVPVDQCYYKTTYRQMTANHMFAFRVKDETRVVPPYDSIQWKTASEAILKYEGTEDHKHPLPLYSKESGYTIQEFVPARFHAQKIGYTHLAAIDKDSNQKLSEIGVLVVPTLSPIIHSLKGVADLTTNPQDFAMPAEEVGVPPEITTPPIRPGLIPLLGTIETPEIIIPPLLPGLIIPPLTPPPGDPAICESPTIIYRGHNRAIIKCLPGEAYKDKEMKAFYGEKPDLSDKKEVKVYKDRDGKNYFVLRGLKGGEFDDKNDEGYTNGRFPYYFKFESEGKSSPTHSFRTLNRWQTIAYYYNLIFTDRLDFQTTDELKNYKGKRKSGIEFYYKPRDAEPLTLQGVKFALLNDPGKEFIERLKVTAGITGNKAQVERLYQIIHDRIYDNDLEKHFDQAGVDFWTAQIEQIEEAKRIDLLGVMFGMMTSPEFFDSMIEQAGGDKLAAQAELAYQIVLQRGADKSGLEYLKTTFKKNKEMREYLVRSDEYDKRLEKIEKDKDLGRKVAIAKLYETIYGRPADVAGVEFWDQYKIKDAKTGKERLATILELKNIFLTSDEFKKVVKD